MPTAATSATNNSYANEGYKEKPIRKKQNTLTWISSVLLRHWAKVLALVLYGFLMRAHVIQRNFLKQAGAKSLSEVQETIQSNRNIVETLREDVRKQKELFKAEKKKSTTTERQSRELQKQVDELKMKHEGPEVEEEKLRAEKREDAWMQQVQLLQQATSRESRRAATEKYLQHKDLLWSFAPLFWEFINSHSWLSFCLVLTSDSVRVLTMCKSR